MASKCVHKGCGKVFTDPDEPCTYHPGAPEFHEGQKGWKCCKPRVLTFDEFLSIPPCTTGKHSTAEETTPAATKKEETITAQTEKTSSADSSATSAISAALSSTTLAAAVPTTAPSTPQPDSDSDDPSLPIAPNSTCRRRGCNSTYESTASSRDNESCTYHPGQAIFHEGSKGWSCCKRRVLEFDEFMRIPGCKTRNRHCFIGKQRKSDEEESVKSVRHDFYQTTTHVIVSIFLKKINSATASITYPDATTLALDLPTSDKKRYKETIPLFGQVDVEKSSHKIMGTKLELSLVKADGRSWPVLRSDDTLSGEIIQVGGAGRI